LLGVEGFIPSTLAR